MTIQELARRCTNIAWSILNERDFNALPEAAVVAVRTQIAQLIIAERATLAWPYDLEASTTARPGAATPPQTAG